VKRILAFMLMIILVVMPISVSASEILDSKRAPIPSEAQVINEPAVASKSAYTPRLTAPSKSNSYYYSNKNIFYSIGYGMPNCTAYAWGRAYELLKTAPKLSVDSAHYWWNYNKTHNYYPSGQSPKLGAVACWDNPYGGHVAVVEKIENNTVTLSHSEWAGRTFYLTEFTLGDKSAGISSSGWKFKGYIYILDGEILPDGDIYRVDSSNGLNLRKGAGTSYSTLTAIPDKTEIVVTETKKAGGYTWGKTNYAGFDGWCVLDFCELVYKLPEVIEPPAVEPPTEEPPAEAPPVFSPAPKPEDVPVTTPDEQKPATPDTAPLPEGGSSGDESEAVFGDINGDGKLTVSDATILQKHLAGMSVTINVERADINDDGKITISDATYIQKVLAGITP